MGEYTSGKRFSLVIGPDEKVIIGPKNSFSVFRKGRPDQYYALFYGFRENLPEVLPAEVCADQWKTKSEVVSRMRDNFVKNGPTLNQMTCWLVDSAMSAALHFTGWSVMAQELLEFREFQEFWDSISEARAAAVEEQAANRAEYEKEMAAQRAIREAESS